MINRIQKQFCTQSALSPLPGSIPASRRFTGAHMPTQPQFRSHPTGSPFNTWVESSNVDKVSCWRTNVLGDSGIRTRTLSVRVERSHHYTTAPLGRSIAYMCLNIINFDAVVFSERRSEEVISFFWRSVYTYSNSAWKKWDYGHRQLRRIIFL